MTRPAFPDVFSELKWRGMVYDATPGCAEMLASDKVTGYNGFDPSAKSLHMGNLIPIMGLVHMQRYGHTPIAIAGGGTGMIGDPGGRKEERQLLPKEKIEENVEGIKVQLAMFLDFKSRSNPARLINNADWLLNLPLIDFLRDTGKNFTVSYMLAKESVKGRLGRDSGISYTEFSYMLLQAFDYLELYRRYGCRVQMGGSDQWGNILAGVDLIKRVEAVTAPDGTVTGYTRGEPHALVYPLLTTATGEKFGKSEGKNVWLDASLTSPYHFFQYWLNVDDRDAVAFLKRFTTLGPDEIAPLEDAVKNKPAERDAQRRLAAEVTSLVHGQSGLAEARRVTGAFFGGRLAQLAARDIEDVLTGAPTGEVPWAALEGPGMPFDRFAVAAGLCASSSEARRLVQQGGAYLNEERVSDAKFAVTLSSLIEGRVAVLRRGARHYLLVRIMK
jgi:tyrosyl-tRNA synthetase